MIDLPIRGCPACDAQANDPCAEHDGAPDLLGRLLGDDDPTVQRALGTTSLFTPTTVDLDGRW